MHDEYAAPGDFIRSLSAGPHTHQRTIYNDTTVVNLVNRLQSLPRPRRHRLYAYHAVGEDFFGDEWDWNRSTQLLERNRWSCLEQCLRMNTPAQRDGLLRVWIDGVMAFDKQDVYLRDIPSIGIEKIWMNVYHGATTKAAEDLRLHIDNVVVAPRPIGCVAR